MNIYHVREFEKKKTQTQKQESLIIPSAFFT